MLCQDHVSSFSFSSLSVLFRLGLVFLLQKRAVNALKLSVLSARCLVCGVFVATSTAMKAKEEKHNEKGQTSDKCLPSLWMFSTNCRSLGGKQEKLPCKECVFPKQLGLLKRQENLELGSG